MKTPKTSKSVFTPVGVDLNTFRVNPKKKMNPKTAPGLKKGTGGVDGAALAAGVAEGSVSFIRGLMLEAIEDITDSPEAQSMDMEPTDQSSDDALGMDGTVDGEEPTPRYVKGAHLVFKRQADVDSFEELWIYKVEEKDPTAHAKIEELILAGTDINPTSMASEDGSQRASSWMAGNAKMMHITGLVN